MKTQGGANLEEPSRQKQPVQSPRNRNMPGAFKKQPITSVTGTEGATGRVAGGGRDAEEEAGCTGQAWGPQGSLEGPVCAVVGMGNRWEGGAEGRHGLTCFHQGPSGCCGAEKRL